MVIILFYFVLTSVSNTLSAIILTSEEAWSSKTIVVQLEVMNISKIENLSKDARRSLISRDEIGWNVKLTIRLNDHVIWVQPNKVNMDEMDYGRWNEWNNNQWNMIKKVWTEGNEMKHEDWNR